MNVSIKTQKELEQIFDTVPERLQKKRSLWASYNNARSVFLESLRKEEVKGKNYSDAVVQWDKERMDAFQQYFHNV